MILHIKFASHVPCILAKFRDFLKPVTVRKTHDIHEGHFDIDDNLMFEACFVMEPCYVSILLLETLWRSILECYVCTKAYLI